MDTVTRQPKAERLKSLRKRILSCQSPSRVYWEGEGYYKPFAHPQGGTAFVWQAYPEGGSLAEEEDYLGLLEDPDIRVYEFLEGERRWVWQS